MTANLLPSPLRLGCCCCMNSGPLGARRLLPLQPAVVKPTSRSTRMRRFSRQIGNCCPVGVNCVEVFDQRSQMKCWWGLKAFVLLGLSVRSGYRPHLQPSGAKEHLEECLLVTGSPVFPSEVFPLEHCSFRSSGMHFLNGSMQGWDGFPCVDLHVGCVGRRSLVRNDGVHRHGSRTEPCGGLAPIHRSSYQTLRCGHACDLLPLRGLLPGDSGVVGRSPDPQALNRRILGPRSDVSGVEVRRSGHRCRHTPHADRRQERGWGARHRKRLIVWPVQQRSHAGERSHRRRRPWCRRAGIDRTAESDPGAIPGKTGFRRREDQWLRRKRRNRVPVPA